MKEEGLYIEDIDLKYFCHIEIILFSLLVVRHLPTCLNYPEELNYNKIIINYNKISEK